MSHMKNIYDTDLGPSLTIYHAGVGYTVAFDRWDAHQPARGRYHWWINAAGDVHYGDDLTVVGDINLPRALETLLSFFDAFLESKRYEARTGRPGENGDLFPAALAVVDQDHVEALRLELDPEEAFS